MQPSPNKSWHVAERISPEADLTLKAYPPFMRQILFNRGCPDEEAAVRFLECRLNGLADPFQITNMERAVRRIGQAVQSQEPVAVYGDYDVDGVSATVLMVEVLRRLGATVREYIPNRFDEGYGLNIEAIESLYESGTRLVITVDCGIRSLREAERARQLGLDLIITDHHHCSAEIPDAFAVINTRQPGDPYPDKELAGVGLAYKLAQALLSCYPIEGVRAEDWLDLVALGTVADLAPLVGENRALVRAGLNLIRTGRRQGLVSLSLAAGLTLNRICASDIGFTLGPRLNAAGRLESAVTAYRLLAEKDFQKAGLLAQQLDDQNRARQSQTREMQQRVEAMLQLTEEDTPLIFAADPDFNQGVVGLAASRIMEMYYRPAIVAYRNEEYTRGSCRSIPGFHITEAMDQCADLLVRHGGHAAAAGFTVLNQHLDVFIARMKAIAAEKLGDLSLLRKTLEADLEIPLAQLNFAMFGWLEQIQPTGYGNPDPLFVTRNLEVRGRWAVGKEKQHLKLKVTDGRNTVSAIAFRMGHLEKDLPARIDLLYSFEKNEFNGQIEPQLNVKDIKPAGFAF